MSILEVKKYPNSILRQKSQPIAEITQKEIQLFQDMLSTMHSSSGIGLAAPQVGINQRFFVVDIGAGPLIVANPEIIKMKGRGKMEEGCLSVSDLMVNIARPSEIIVKGLNEKGKPVEIKAEGLLARVILHEIDHLNGKLIIDYMNFLNKIKFKAGNKGRS